MIKYKFVDKKARETVSLLPYANWISHCFKRVCPEVTVKVYEHHYEVYGKISNNQLRRIGKLINQKPELGRWAHKRGTGKQVFTRF